MNELTPEDCEKFDAYVQKWQQALNLSDWRIERSPRRAKKNMAEVSFDDGARLATYRIGVSFGAAPVTAFNLEQTALHEVLHVFLHEVLAADQQSLEGAEHRVINVLEKLLLKGAQ